MNYEIFPPVRRISYPAGHFDLKTAGSARVSRDPFERFGDQIEKLGITAEGSDAAGFWLGIGQSPAGGPIQAQGYRLSIGPDGLLLESGDASGFAYGLDTLSQILVQGYGGTFSAVTIEDEPILEHRGLMLDISRGKIYTLDYLKDLAARLAAMRYNVLQLYTEHPFDFSSHPDINGRGDVMTAEEIKGLQATCQSLGIELQANLQSLGHMRRILTRPAYQALSESELFWSLDTTKEASYELLNDLYRDLLPLFDSDRVNVCCDEPYDLGLGGSAASGKSKAQLYFDHLMRIHGLASSYGKKIMLFGDVIRYYPDFAAALPEDVVFLDWIYDPKAHYETPAVFRASGRPFWVSPGTGNWNTLFPRLDGSIRNIVGLITEGVRQSAQGMLLTDWNDHGGYTQPSPAYYLYAYAAGVAWSGADPGKDAVGSAADRILSLPGYSKIIERLGEIYHIPPIWSKNRSQCVMALFDEPITGQSVTGPEPPPALRAFDLNLPDPFVPVLERHSHHPMRPIFRIPIASLDQIDAIVQSVRPGIDELPDGEDKAQLAYIARAFSLMSAKLRFSDRLRRAMAEEDVSVPDLLAFEEELDGLIARYASLQEEFIILWRAIAKTADLHRCVVYFSHILARLDYLRDWISIQREELGRGSSLDRTFTSYETGGYRTLPTY